MTHEWQTNKAALAEIERIKEICKRVLNVDVEPRCSKASNFNEETNQWVTGYVVISYPTKGNIKLTRLLHSHGYTSQSYKVREDEYRYIGYAMQTRAEIAVELEY